MDDPRSKNSRSKDFRYVYSNVLATAFTGTEATIVFGIKENPVDPSRTMLEEIAVIMSASSAKTLAVTLTRILEEFEKQSGVPIPANGAALAEVEAKLAQMAKPSPTS